MRLKLRTLITTTILTAGTAIFATYATAAEPACDFQGEDLWNIRQSKLYKVSEPVRTPLPDMFLAHVDKLGEFDIDNCEDAVVVAKVTYEPSGLTYDVYWTDQDDCDGGNAFGLAARESTEDVVAVMNDQAFTCID